MAFGPISFPRDNIRINPCRVKDGRARRTVEAVFVCLFGAAASGKQPGGIEELERSRREGRETVAYSYR